MGKRHISKRAAFLAVLLALAALPAVQTLALDAAALTGTNRFYGTAWAFFPILAAAIVHYFSKSLYFSLAVGIAAGAFLSVNLNAEATADSVVRMFAQRAGDAAAISALGFLVLLGLLKTVLVRAGVAEAFAKTAGRVCRTKRSAMLASLGLSALLHFEESLGYRLVGGEMSRLTDKHGVSRAKLAYIAAQSAVMGLIVPVSGFAVAVAVSVGSEQNGYWLFLKTIPMNLYGWVSLGMALCLIFLRFDYGPMRQHEILAELGDVFGGTGNEYPEDNTSVRGKRAGFADLLLPALGVPVFCMVGVLYTGGFFNGTGLTEALKLGNVTAGLMLGAIAALVFAFIFLCARGVMRPSHFQGALTEGFRRMADAVLILCFAWMLSGYCLDGLGADEFLRTWLADNELMLQLFPALCLAASALISYSIGTSWGAFTVLVPILAGVFAIEGGGVSQSLILSVSACLSGAVGGGHMSPRSAITRYAAKGAKCGLNGHIETQRPYAGVALILTFVGYLLAGMFESGTAALICSMVLMVAVMMIFRKAYEYDNAFSS